MWNICLVGLAMSPRPCQDPGRQEGAACREIRFEFRVNVGRQAAGRAGNEQGLDPRCCWRP
jgi:hypothetical protein